MLVDTVVFEQSLVWTLLRENLFHCLLSTSKLTIEAMKNIIQLLSNAGTRKIAQEVAITLIIFGFKILNKILMKHKTICFLMHSMY